MINLQVLGRLDLRGADGGSMQSILAQPKRQGLLAYLAVAVPRGYHRRDTLVGLLWPDSDEEHARASLSRAVNALRQTLGADTLISRGHADLGLDWHRFWCDAAGFEEALDAGKPAEAMALYGGDLLPGFYIEEAPEFAQWLERERSRLRGRAVQAARLLSEREEQNGRLDTAVEWARRATALEPFDESALRRVLLLLEKNADRAGALRAYDEFAARMKAELDDEPAEETRAVMSAIRDRELHRATPVPGSSLTPIPVMAPVVAPPSSQAPTQMATQSLARRRPSTRVTVGIGALALGALGIWAVASRAHESPPANEAAATVAVLPFVVQSGTPSAPKQLGSDMVTLLSERLNHSGVLHAVDARRVLSAAPSQGLPPTPPSADSARRLVARFNPRLVLLGEILPRNDSLLIKAALFDSGASQPVARASITSTANDLAQVAADLSWQLMEAQPTRRAPLWDRTPTALTQSVPALRAYLAAETEYRAGRYAEAAHLYKTAVDADTTFALAYLYLARSANWINDYAMEDFASRRAMAYIARLSPLDQLLAKAWAAYLGGRPRDAERFSRLALVNEPGMSEAWFALAEVRFHWGAQYGWTIPEARDAYERAYATSTSTGALVHLARIAASSGQRAAVDSLVRQALVTGVDHPQSLELRGLRAYADGDFGEQERVRAEIARLDGDAAFSVVTQVVTHSAEQPRTRDLAAVLRQPRYSRDYRLLGAVLEAELAMAHGRAADATRLLVPGADLNRANTLERRAAFAVLPFRNLPRAELALLRDSLLQLPQEELTDIAVVEFPSDRIFGVRHRYLLSMLALKLGDTATARRIADEMAARADNRSGQSYIGAAANILHAELLRTAGKSAEALAALGEPRGLTYLPGVAEYMSGHERFLRAELNGDLHKWSESLRWYETFPDPGAYDIPYLAAVHAGAGAAHEGLGNRDAARASYQRAAALWANADPEFAPALAGVRARIAALH